MGGAYAPQTNNGDATVGDIVNYIFSTRNTGSVTLSNIDLICPTVSRTLADAPLRVNEFAYHGLEIF